MKYCVTYVDNGDSSMKVFKKKKDRDKWIYEWLLENHKYGETNGYWIDLIFEGNIEWNRCNYEKE